MTTYAQYQREFVSHIAGTAQAGMLPRLQALLDALPYYGDNDFAVAHRGVLGAVLQLGLPNDAIVPEPGDPLGTWSFQYAGPYSGYADAFFHGRATTDATTEVVNRTGLSVDWWQGYAIAVLTDAARQAAGVAVDTGKLTSDLTAFDTALRPALTATFVATIRKGYGPTATALRDLDAAGQLEQARGDLAKALASGQFTANINAAFIGGGEPATAALWFLYTLWVTLAALGCADVDARIDALRTAGLTVPDQVAPGRWWNGGYTQWHIPLAGVDVAAAAAGVLTADLPEREYIVTDLSQPGRFQVLPLTATKGYARSLCLWGPLNRYPPGGSSCLGAGTGVLMADGSVKPIEDVRIGDEVRSVPGPGRVALVESPGRHGRALHRVNGLRLSTTAGHPFRAVDGPRRRAVDPWALIDAVPTMVADGIGRLAPGAELAGWPHDVVVREVTHAPYDADVVYDLVVDSGERGHGVYFVGGPDVFLAVDAESADPFHDVPTTLAVAAALGAALPAVRAHIPVTALSDLLTCVDIPSSAPPAPPRQTIPDVNFYLRDGEWDSHASALESELVRRLARTFRRHCATPWAPQDPSTRRTCVHDLELLGDVVLNAPLTLHLTRGEETKQIPLGDPRWHLTPDTTVEFTDPTTSDLIGVIETNTRFLGHFRASGPGEHYVFDSQGTVIGRIALTQRGPNPTNAAWTRQDAKATAVTIGHHTGTALAQLALPAPHRPLPLGVDH